ncbi:error-prone DNA polymerase [Sphingobium phenoxybenzoativorans]|uniref:Error-prone DNA polymerase n=1 Tax=Sphingobium phenoxybenzoativorans TaxID=1592790 RepID=A0A975Q0B9_9SPHN|nr:error-prone DNA polymerase [Sphingobium phenoxybenzoativorans]QUT04152.1 error-prone DNA polymerase [Sphingobium phenoxybenzoativorans]
MKGRRSPDPALPKSTDRRAQEMLERQRAQKKGELPDHPLPPSEAPPFAELVAATSYSFLRGASRPSDMVHRAMELGLTALGIADRNSVAGVVRAWTALKEAGEKAEAAFLADKQAINGPDAELTDAEKAACIPALRLLTGARLVFSDGAPDIIAYPMTRLGWGRLTRLLTAGNMRAVKGDCILRFADLLDYLDDLLLIVMPVSTLMEPEDAHGSAPDYQFEDEPQARETISHIRLVEDPAPATLYDALSRLSARAPGRVWLGVSNSYGGRDSRRLETLRALARKAGTPLIATNDALYATSDDRPLHDILSCIRLGSTIADAGRRLEANGERHLKSPADMAHLFRACPEAVAETVRFARRISFDLQHLSYEYPHEPVPDGWTPDDWLEDLVRRAAKRRYGRTLPPKVRALIGQELKLIRKQNYAYYFLTVHDLVTFARSRKPPILCQGRGSAANSIVCFLLGVTSVDPLKHDLLFSRFVSDERREPPDIDVDFEHERREEVMQYVYQRYGRHRAGITATVIHYRSRSAVRQVAKALGLSEDIPARMASTVWGSWSGDMEDKRITEAGFDLNNPEIARLKSLVDKLLDGPFPRHLSQHVGGFVLTQDRLDETVPIHNGAMKDRSFIEWDKDDIDALGLMKVDVLALGMLTCIRKAYDLMRANGLGDHDLTVDLNSGDEAVYDMLCKGDSIGVFQVESRAQINMLPRLRPRNLYDLTVQVAIVRPGPIEGDMVHPYLRRRAGLEEPEFPSPAAPHNPNELRDLLKDTYGVPLFQEQAMKLAIVAAGFTPSEANQLRRAMATFRNLGGIDKFEEKLVGGMTARGYEADFARRCFKQIEGFGSYGFPESHALSFARLVYVSAWIKCHHPAVFACALLNSQPMGFYAPAQLVRDAREHGVEVRGADVNASCWDNDVERVAEGGPLALRLGFRQIDGFREEWAKSIAGARAAGRFAGIEDLARRARLPTRALRLLADADACRSLGHDRRNALWEVRRTPTNQLPLFAAADARELGEEPDAALPAMPLSEHVATDYHMTRLSLKGHPMQFLRPLFQGEGVLSCAETSEAKNGARVRTAGIVLVRQRPGKGNAIFITLEDETGITNILLWARLFEMQRRPVMASRLMVVEGEVQRSKEGVVHLMASRVIDRTQELDRLSENHRAQPPLCRADVFAHPQQPRTGVHPRNVRILPKSRDFH